MILYKKEIVTLRNKIEKHFDYLSSEFQLTSEVLFTLNKMIHLDMNHSMIFQWLCENEASIDIINELLERLKEE